MLFRSEEVREAARAAGRDAKAITGAMYLTLAVDDDVQRADDKINDYLANYYGVPAAGMAEQAGHTIVITHPPVQRWSPGLAAVLSFFVPGLGQLYKGQILNGIAWFLFVGMGYLALVLPGLVLHLFCILGAASGNPWTEGRTEIVNE